MSTIKEQVDKNTDSITRLENLVKSMFIEMNKNMIAYKEETSKNISEMKEDTRKLKEEFKEFKDEMKEFKDEMKKDIKHLNKQWGNLAQKMGTLVEDIFSPSFDIVVYSNDGGNSEANRSLAWRRAQFVRDYLAGRGCNVDYAVPVAWGSYTSSVDLYTDSVNGEDTCNKVMFVVRVK